MNRMRLYFLLMLLSVPQFGYGFDKIKFRDQLLSAINESPLLRVEIGDPQRSAIGDLYELPVSIEGQKMSVFLSKDKKKFILGSVFEMAANYDQERISKIKLDSGFSKGSPQAPVTIVEFSDVQCGYCKKAHFAFETELYKDYKPEQVRWVYKHFPLNMHEWAEDGAVAASCAGEQNQEAFWVMMHDLFDNSSSIKKENFQEKVLKYAMDIQIDTTTFAACLSNPQIKERINADRNEGVQVGVRSTPTFFINGRQLRGFKNFSDVKAIIDYQLGISAKE